MIAFFKRLIRDRRGNMIVMAAAGLPVVIGAAGLATDTIQWTLWKRQLQRAADSAAISGVYELEAGGTTSTAQTTVAHDLTINRHTVMGLKSGFPIVTFPASAGVLTNQVSVTLAVQQKLAFSSLFMTTAPTITARATAASVATGGGACVHALEKDPKETGIKNNGNTEVFAPDCVFYSNSPSTNAASAGGSSKITALAIAAVGGIKQSNNWKVGSYRPYSPALPDPFRNVTPDPAAMKCSATVLDENTDFATLPAGTNCFSSLSVGSHKTVNVPAGFGPIYLNGGGIDLKGTFNCSGCTLVLTNSSLSPTAPIGSITSNAQAKNNITAPTSGYYKGIAIYQDRRATLSSPHINGGSDSAITGAIYFPNQELWFNGNSNMNSTCTMLVSRRVVFTGTSGLKFKGLNDCGLEGLPSADGLRMVRLVA